MKRRSDAGPPVRGKLVLDRLVEAGELTDSQRSAALSQLIHGHASGTEAVIALGFMEEDALLKFMANLYQTRFVSTEKLSKAAIGQTLVAAVPQQLAERLLVCPILYDHHTKTLSIVAADPSVDDVAQLVKVASSARKVLVYVAREAAIQAAISKHYDGMFTAFDALTSPLVPVLDDSGEDVAPAGWEQVGGLLFEEHGESLVPVQGRARPLQRAQSNTRQPSASAAPKGLSGSLSDMSLPDVIQILANSRKSGELSVRSIGKAGALMFNEGKIVDARFGGKTGEEAVYSILALSEGDFSLDPSIRYHNDVIGRTTDYLLLEGLRRLDES